MMAKIEDLIGKVLTNVDNDGREIIFTGDDGRKWKLYHENNCCESVEVEDVIGYLSDLVGSPIMMAEEVSSEGYPDANKYDHDSYTWTFYKFATVKGYVTVRWYGTSNGYYSESVDFEELA